MRKFLSTSIVLLVVLFLGSLSPLFLFAKNLFWETEGQIFSDPTIHNVEVVSLATGQFRMYFHQGTEMKSAVSTDGRSFTVEPGVRLQGTMPTLVTLPDGRRRMYYASPTGNTASPTNVFKSAVSTDGLKWTVEPGTRLAPGGEFDPDNIVHPSVIALPDGGYRMYYDGEIRKTDQEFTWRILSATSTDGLTWVKDGGVRVNVNEGPLYADLVWSSAAAYYPLTGTYQLYFSVQTPAENLIDGIYSATSTDGLLFTVSDQPELTPASESGEYGVGGQVGSYQDPFVLELPEGKRMYYWVNGSGIYSARLVSAATEDNQSRSILETIKQKATDLWERIKGVRLPENSELYIIPTILLVTGVAAVIYLWRSRIRR